MDIKEFKVMDSDKKSSRKLYPDEQIKEGKLNYKIYALIGALALAVVIIIAVFIKINAFDIKKYINVSYTGVTGYATASFSVDEAALSQKLLGKNPDSDKQYYVSKFIESLNIYTTDTDIGNGDTVHVVIEYNEAYASEAGADISKNEYTYKARGIGDGAYIDIYEAVNVVFSGISPDAKVIVSNDWTDDYLKDIIFTADKTEGIKLNDSIKVSCDKSFEDLARHGIRARAMEMLYTADMLNSYCESKDMVNTDVMQQIYNEIADTITKETADVTYRILFAATGDTNYLYHMNEETASNIKITDAYFLKRKENVADTDNYIVVQASAQVTDNEDSREIYFAFVYTNAYVTVNGEFNIGHDNQNQRFSCAADKASLYQQYVGSLSNNYTIEKIR